MKILLQLLAVVAISFLGNLAVGAAMPRPWLALLVGVAVAAGTVLGYGWVVRRTERRVPSEVGRAGAASGLGAGTLVGIALFGLVIVCIAMLGDYQVAGLGSPSGAVAMVGFMATAAAAEEVLFRGVLFRHVERWFGTWVALVGTGLVFGLAHLANPHATLAGAIAIAAEAGGVAGAAYVATRRLWLPIGLHFGWNFAESGIFSTEVSGNGTHQGLLDATVSGPTLVTGGEFGPEASLFAVVFCLAAAAVLLGIARRRGHLVPLRLPRRRAAAVTLSR